MQLTVTCVDASACEQIPAEAAPGSQHSQQQQASDSTSTYEMSVSDSAFDCSYHEVLVHQVVNAYLAGARQGSAQQKNRSAARGGGRKPWRQKRLGRARAGTIRSPIWRGGGVTFAASPRDYSQKVNRKMYRGAMRSILSELNRSERLRVVDDLAPPAPKTRQLVNLLAALESGQDLLLVHHDPGVNLTLSARNLPQVELCQARHLNPWVLLAHEAVLMTESAVREIEGMLA